MQFSPEYFLTAVGWIHGRRTHRDRGPTVIWNEKVIPPRDKMLVFHWLRRPKTASWTQSLASSAIRPIQACCAPAHFRFLPPGLGQCWDLRPFKVCPVPSLHVTVETSADIQTRQLHIYWGSQSLFPTLSHWLVAAFSLQPLRLVLAALFHMATGVLTT
jgi:hypothetical protein